MKISLSRDGLFFVLRHGIINERRALGFKIKPRSKMLFSERNGRHGFCLGPIYFGRYH